MSSEETPLTSQCPYCFKWFSFLHDGKGSSEYEMHVKEEQSTLRPDRLEDYSLEQWQFIIDNMTDFIWPYLVEHYKFTGKYASTNRPVVEVTTHLFSFKGNKTSANGITRFANAFEDNRARIKIFLHTKGTPFVLTTLVHELFHALGYNHGPVKGYAFNSHTGDVVSEVVLSNLDLIRPELPYQKEHVHSYTRYIRSKGSFRVFGCSTIFDGQYCKSEKLKSTYAYDENGKRVRN